MKFNPTPTWSLDVTQDMIDVTSDRPSFNEHWRFTDAQSHEHARDCGFPSLDRIVDASHWCDGTEGWLTHDPHMVDDEVHYECRVCHEVIVPKVDPPYTPKWLPGLVEATLTGVRSDGVTVRVLLKGEDVAMIREADDERREVIVREVLDSAPAERILSLTYST